MLPSGLLRPPGGNGKGGSRSKLSDFETLSTIGKGSFGIVYRVRRKQDNKIYCLKSIDMSNFTTKETQDAMNEVRILANIQSEYVVQYVDSFLHGKSLHIVMEYCSNGDLYKWLLKRGRKMLTEDQVWHYFLQTCIGLQHIHAKKILHRDLKSMNLFLDAKNRIKIGDLGVAKVMGSQQFAQTIVGTPYYLSPELCEDKPYNEKSDIWALGCLLYELAMLKPPFDAKNQGALILKIIRGKYAPLKSSYSSNLRKVLDACLMKDTRKRPGCDQILSSVAVYEKAKALGYVLPDSVELLWKLKQQRLKDEQAAEASKSIEPQRIGLGEMQPTQMSKPASARQPVSSRKIPVRAVPQPKPISNRIKPPVMLPKAQWRGQLGKKPVVKRRVRGEVREMGPITVSKPPASNQPRKRVERRSEQSKLSYTPIKDDTDSSSDDDLLPPPIHAKPSVDPNGAGSSDVADKGLGPRKYSAAALRQLNQSYKQQPYRNLDGKKPLGKQHNQHQRRKSDDPSAKLVRNQPQVKTTASGRPNASNEQSGQPVGRRVRATSESGVHDVRTARKVTSRQPGVKKQQVPITVVGNRQQRKVVKSTQPTATRAMRKPSTTRTALVAQQQGQGKKKTPVPQPRPIAQSVQVAPVKTVRTKTTVNGHLSEVSSTVVVSTPQPVKAPIRKTPSVRQKIPTPKQLVRSVKPTPVDNAKEEEPLASRPEPDVIAVFDLVPEPDIPCESVLEGNLETGDAEVAVPIVNAEPEAIMNSDSLYGDTEDGDEMAVTAMGADSDENVEDIDETDDTFDEKGIDEVNDLDGAVFEREVRWRVLSNSGDLSSPLAANSLNVQNNTRVDAFKPPAPFRPDSKVGSPEGMSFHVQSRGKQSKIMAIKKEILQLEEKHLELKQLLDKTRDSCVQQIGKVNFKKLYDFFHTRQDGLDDDAKAHDDMEVSRFVTSIISFSELDVVQKIYALLALEEQFMSCNDDIGILTRRLARIK